MFDYKPGDSLVHRLNPVTKLVLSIGLVVIAFMLPDFWGPAFVAFFVLCVAASAGVFWPVVKPTAIINAPLLIVVLLVQGIFYSGNQTPLVTVGPVTFWEEGVLYALLIFFRILVLVCAVLVAVLSTHPKQMMVALTDKGLSPKIAYVFMATLQFVPDMQRRSRAIVEAQQARGLDLKANLLGRFQALFALLGPLLVGALISAETRSLALEARGFSRKGTHTHLLDVPDGRTDRILRWSMVVVVLAIVVWRVAF